MHHLGGVGRCRSAGRRRWGSGRGRRRRRTRGSGRCRPSLVEAGAGDEGRRSAAPVVDEHAFDAGRRRPRRRRAGRRGATASGPASVKRSSRSAGPTVSARGPVSTHAGQRDGVEARRRRRWPPRRRSGRRRWRRSTRRGPAAAGHRAGGGGVTVIDGPQIGGEAAVDGQGDAGDERGVVGAEERHRGGDLGRVRGSRDIGTSTRSAGRAPPPGHVGLVGDRPAVGAEVGGHEAGAHAVGPDAVRRRTRRRPPA